VDVIRGNMNLGSMRRVSSAPRPQEVPPSGELRSVKEGSPVFVWQGDQTRLNRVGVGTYETFDAAKQVRKKVQARIEGRDDISSLTGNVWIFSLSPEEESS